MSKITVACSKNDPARVEVQKYEGWNIPGAVAPNGVSATRYLRKTLPNLEELTGLARFLVEHVPRCVAGNMPSFNPAARVRCYNGRSEAEEVLDLASNPDRRGVYRVTGMRFKDRSRAVKLAENLVKAYDLERKPAMIEDWHFRIITKEETDTEYWNKQADLITKVGTELVVIGEDYFFIGDAS